MESCWPSTPDILWCWVDYKKLVSLKLDADLVEGWCNRDGMPDAIITSLRNSPLEVLRGIKTRKWSLSWDIFYYLRDPGYGAPENWKKSLVDLMGMTLQWSESHSVMSNSLLPHGLWPTRLLCPWDSPGKNTRVGCHVLLQGIFPNQRSNLGLLHCRQILYDLSHPGSL